jgi:hypothetical protein
MENKPADFFLGIVNFFAVLVPGAVLAFFGMDLALNFLSQHPYILGSSVKAIQGELRGWVIFIFASYILGQFVFLVGSPLDLVYDKVRLLSKCIQKRFDLWCPGCIGRKWIENDQMYLCATAIKQKNVNCSQGEGPNTFQWAKAAIELGHPAAAVELHRYEADQKLFRSLTIVLLVLCAIFVYQAASAEPLLYLLPLIGLSFWRYVNQRRKSQDTAYTYLIVSKSQFIQPSGSP